MTPKTMADSGQSLKILRQDFPALWLALSFAPPKQRVLYADLLLLWLELNRAASAQERLIAAARITWWQDAMERQQSSGVPLAESLLTNEQINKDSLAASLSHIASNTLHGIDSPDVHAVFADFMAGCLDTDAEPIAIILRKIKGKTGETISPAAALPKVLKMIDWLTEKPARLNYPAEEPLLALSMLLASFSR